MAIDWQVSLLETLAQDDELDFVEGVARWLGRDRGGDWRSMAVTIDLLACRIALRMADAIVAERGVGYWTGLCEAEATLRPDTLGPRALATRFCRR